MSIRNSTDTLPQPIIDLREKIYAQYSAELHTLPIDIAFHFVSRLYLWQRFKDTAELKDVLFPAWGTLDGSVDALMQTLPAKAQLPPEVPINSAERRMRYFKKYPMLRSYNAVLLRSVLLRNCFEIDSSRYFKELFDKVPAQETYEQLSRDKETIAELSTYAVNFLYFFSHFALDDPSSLDINNLLSIGLAATHEDMSPEDIQLILYLYTHCVLGESEFYYKSVPNERAQVYITMMREAEKLIADNFELVHLDNKFEFLVCCAIAGIDSPLRAAIYKEALASKSMDGDFLVDTLNNYPQSHRTSLAMSEHRNVLFILSTLAYEPLGN